MSKLTPKTIAFNGAGIVLGVGLFAYVVKDALTKEHIPGCVERYPIGTEFSLTGETGAPMSPIELQARTGISSVGILENASVVKSKNSGPAALQVSLDRRAGAADDEISASGIAFEWSPSGMQNAKAACLSYQVWLPKKFEFGTGVRLFGLAGRSQDAEDASIGSRVVWRQGGQGDLRIKMVESKGYKPSGKQNFQLSTGRWTSVQKEIVLNNPGQENGLLRLWINGDLVVDRKDIAWRKTDAMALSNVQANIGYVSLQKQKRVPENSVVRLSPPVVSWR